MTEAWLTGPVEGVHPLLLPVAHSFLQVRAEIGPLLDGISDDQLWTAPAASASIGFHAVHLVGSTDRLLTYARGEQLSDTQMAAARSEKTVTGLSGSELSARVRSAMNAAVDQLRATSADHLTEPREVGRQRLPSTTLGLLVHAAEHATRHAGQISTLRKIVLS